MTDGVADKARQCKRLRALCPLLGLHVRTTLLLAILRFGWDQGPGLDFRGIHHFGVLVEDVDAHIEKLEKLGASCFARRPPDVKTFYETKFHGPDRVVFDITDHPWKGAAPLPTPEEAAKKKAPLQPAQS